jgi:hypothetical protein
MTEPANNDAKDIPLTTPEKTLEQLAIQYRDSYSNKNKLTKERFKELQEQHSALK